MAEGLPYDGTPPPEEQAPQDGAPSGIADPLDMPLDDYTPEVPEHVKDLMGRMSRGKLYLLEESPGILHMNGEERVRGDPRLAALASQLNTHDPSSWLSAVSETAPSPIRHNALFVRSEVIKHLSTSKVFSWATSLGAGVMGIEWLNDETLHLVFPSPSSALLGLGLLSKAGFDPTEGDDPLLERSAHTVPIHLLPHAEPDPKESQAGNELLAGSTDDSGSQPRKRGRGTFASDTAGQSDLPSLDIVEKAEEFKVADGVDPNARITVRFATEADSDLRKEAKVSDWYKRHGRRAGKETAPGTRDIRGSREEEGSFSWQGRGTGEGRDFAKRIGRERRDDPYRRRNGGREGGRGRGRNTADDLDKELENMARRRIAGEGGGEDSMEVEGEESRDMGRRRNRRERKGKDDLDKELDDLFAARTNTDLANTT